MHDERRPVPAQVPDLMTRGFQHSNLFRHMPLFDEIRYAGHDEDKVRYYKAAREGQTCVILALNFIRAEEKILWEAVEDFLKRSTSNAVGGVRGVFIFDLLTIDIHREIKTFKHAELSTLIANTAITLPAEGVTVIQYSSAYALLQKTLDADWGKITFKTAVSVFRDKPEYLDVLIRQLLKEYMFPRDPVIVLLNDLSQNPVYDERNELQQLRLRKVIADLIPTSIEFIPEVYIQDKNGARELLSGSRL